MGDIEQAVVDFERSLDMTTWDYGQRTAWALIRAAALGPAPRALTPRQQEAVTLYRAGFSTYDIGARMNITQQRAYAILLRAGALSRSKAEAHRLAWSRPREKRADRIARIIGSPAVARERLRAYLEGIA